MCTKCMRPQKLFKLIVNSFSMFEKHLCIAYKFRINANIINTPCETLSRKRYTYTGGGASWWKGRREMKWNEKKKTNVHLLENNNEDVTVCWLHHSVILSMVFFFSWRFSVVIILMKNSSKQNDKFRVNNHVHPNSWCIMQSQGKKRIKILFGLSKTFELKIKYENMLICREFENGQWISLCERW